MPKKAPSYRKRNGQALVTLTDSLTKRRRDYWLGEYDTSQSREPRWPIQSGSKM